MIDHIDPKFLRVMQGGSVTLRNDLYQALIDIHLNHPEYSIPRVAAVAKCHIATVSQFRRAPALATQGDELAVKVVTRLGKPEGYHSIRDAGWHLSGAARRLSEQLGIKPWTPGAYILLQSTGTAVFAGRAELSWFLKYGASWNCMVERAHQHLTHGAAIGTQLLCYIETAEPYTREEFCGGVMQFHGITSHENVIIPASRGVEIITAALGARNKIHWTTTHLHGELRQPTEQLRYAGPR